MKMVDKQKTIFFHSIQFFNRHIKQLITSKFHDQHKILCYEYKKNTSSEEVNLEMLRFGLGGIRMEL